MNFAAVHVVPKDLLEFLVEFGSGLGLAVATVSYREIHLHNRSNVSYVICVPQCNCVVHFSLAPVLECVYAGRGCLSFGRRRKGK